MSRSDGSREKIARTNGSHERRDVEKMHRSCGVVSATQYVVWTSWFPECKPPSGPISNHDSAQVPRNMLHSSRVAPTKSREQTFHGPLEKKLPVNIKLRYCVSCGNPGHSHASCPLK